MDFTLSEEEKKILLETARETIARRLGAGRSGAGHPESSEKPRQGQTPALKEHCGAFVTLHKGGELRGCIGYLTASKPLIETVADAAKSSAFQDTRFSPLTKEELEHVEIEISVLSPLKRIEKIEEIQVGRHGIIIRKGFRSGLLLPQVATENNWNRETFLTNTCYKAGLSGDCWKESDTVIEIFSALVFNESELR